MDPDRFEDAEGMLLAGLRSYHRFEVAGDGIEQQWIDFAAAPGSTSAHGEAFGAICGADGEGMEYLTGFRVDTFDGLPPGIGRMRVPPQRYAVFRHASPGSVGDSWRKVMAWLADGPYRSAETPDFERVPDLSSRLAGRDIEIWIGVADR